jgi:hypothetical protein
MESALRRLAPELLGYPKYRVSLAWLCWVKSWYWDWRSFRQIGRLKAKFGLAFRSVAWIGWCWNRSDYQFAMYH